MFEPDSIFSVILFVLIGIAAVVAIVFIGKKPWVVAPAVIAIAAPLLAGALWVNVSYGYYQKWNDAINDLRGKPLPGEQPAPIVNAASQPNEFRPGRLVNMKLAGPASGITRDAIVWLPGEYDDPAFSSKRFPVMVLMHGDPGEPRGFVYGLHIDDVANDLIRAGQMQPMVIVMPTVFAGWSGQQCLDALQGPKNETYLTKDVPADVEKTFRVDPPGKKWVAAGLSEGGYCAADLALRHPGAFGGVASLDGYYSPITNRGIGAKLFGNNAELQRQATPQLLIDHAEKDSLGFWIMSGDADAGDRKEAQAFADAAGKVGPVRTVFVTDGKHTTPSWRAALPDLLTWSSNFATSGTAATGTISVKVQN